MYSLHKITKQDDLLWSEYKYLLRNKNLTEYDVKDVFAFMNKDNEFNENFPENSLCRYMYAYGSCNGYYGQEIYDGLELPFDQNSWLVILLKDDKLILGRYGTYDFGWCCEECHYRKLDVDDTLFIYKLISEYVDVVVDTPPPLPQLLNSLY